MAKYKIENYSGSSYMVETNEYGIKKVDGVPDFVAENLKVSVKRHMKKNNLSVEQALGKSIGAYSVATPYEEEDDKLTVTDLQQESELG